MRIQTRKRPLILCGLAMLALASASPAVAQTAATPSAVNETQGATTGLGSSHRFHSKALAQAHCTNDTVIWSIGPQLTYVAPGSPNYGKGHGFYACKGEANDAGFKPQ